MGEDRGEGAVFYPLILTFSRGGEMVFGFNRVQLVISAELIAARKNHAFFNSANIRFGVNGTSRSLISTASKIALEIAAGIGTVDNSPAPSGSTSWRLISTRSISGTSWNFKMG